MGTQDKYVAQHAVGSDTSGNRLDQLRRRARTDLLRWLREGKIRPWTTVYDEGGLAAAPKAFVDMLGGQTRGTTVVRVSRHA